jgi:hypothetical protein
MLAFVLFGWAFLHAALWWDAKQLFLLVAASPTPSEELLQRLGSDGAPRVLALFFGWVFAGVYFSLWWGIFYVGRRIFARPSA